MNKDKNISIILPVLNESKNLEYLIPEFTNLLSNNLKVLYEIIVVDDGSTDGTQVTVNNFRKANKNIRLIERNSPKSLPLSIFDGIRNSKFNSVMWLDADGSMDVESSKRIIQTYFSENCNAVVGSRFVDGGGYKGKTKEGFSLKIFGNLFKSEDSLIAVFLSNILNRVLSRLLAVPVKDLTSGFIIIQKNYLKYEMFNGFNYGEYFISLILELTKKDAKIIEVGYVCKPRKYGQSKTSTNFIKLAKLSIPYLFLAIKSRKILYENN